MSAGLPGLGLGGVFFLLQALISPLVELSRMTRGRSTRETRRAVGKQFGLAVGMVTLVGVCFGAVNAALARAGITEPERAGGLGDLPISAGVLAILTLAAALVLVEAASPFVRREPPPRRRAPLRAERLQRERRGF